ITATFMNPPTDGVACCRRRYLRSRQEKRHKDENDHHNRERNLHRRDKTPIRLFVSGIIVTRCDRVLDLGVLGHFKTSQLQQLRQDPENWIATSGKDHAEADKQSATALEATSLWADLA